MTRIGVFGGTFDPPHNGHLIIADRAVRQLKLARVVFVPAYLPPHKRKGTSASPSQRYSMIQKVIHGRRKFDATPVEIERKGVSYTIDTLRDLKKMYASAKFYLIVGGDNYRHFRTWKSSRQILALATLVVYRRSGMHGEGSLKKRKGVVWLTGGPIDVSSTMIRHKVQRGESIRKLVSPKIERFIRSQKLYR